MTAFIFHFTVKPGNQSAVIESFDVMASAPGFVRLELFQSENIPEQFTCVEIWQTKADHQAFVEATPREVSENWLALLAELPTGGHYQSVKVL